MCESRGLAFTHSSFRAGDPLSPFLLLHLPLSCKEIGAGRCFLGAVELFLLALWGDLSFNIWGFPTQSSPSSMVKGVQGWDPDLGLKGPPGSTGSGSLGSVYRGRMRCPGRVVVCALKQGV